MLQPEPDLIEFKGRTTRRPKQEYSPSVREQSYRSMEQPTSIHILSPETYSFQNKHSFLDPLGWSNFSPPRPSRNIAPHLLGLCRVRGDLFVSLPYKGHNESYVSGSLQRRHPEPARLSRHLERFTTKLLLETRLVPFRELHENNPVCYEKADELSIVEVAKASHHRSGTNSFPFQNFRFECLLNLDHLLLVIILQTVTRGRIKRATQQVGNSSLITVFTLRGIHEIQRLWNMLKCNCRPFLQE